jgi:DMSO/TMAO reductase YedYZ molybdopterin-dependent catalytic subunit
LTLGGAAVATLAACKKEADRVVESLTPPPTAIRRRTLRNENRPEVKPDWNVRFYDPFEAVDHGQWRLTVEGHVERPQVLSLDDVLALPSVSQESRMKCVECWSAKARWEGFNYQALADLVKPTGEAQWIHFECADGYYEALPIEQLAQPRVLWATKMDNELLLDEFGAPLRLIVPFLYGYKGPKTITWMNFQGSGGPGYWTATGAYSREGDIKSGRDRPLDLEGSREIHGGEITDY